MSKIYNTTVVVGDDAVAEEDDVVEVVSDVVDILSVVVDSNLVVVVASVSGSIVVISGASDVDCAVDSVVSVDEELGAAVDEIESQSIKSSGFRSSNGLESEQVPPDTAASKSLLSRISQARSQSQLKGSDIWIFTKLVPVRIF